jgi:hypothetical protein
MSAARDRLFPAVFGRLLAGIPIYVWMGWRAARAPTEAEPLTVEGLLPPIPDKPPVTR